MKKEIERRKARGPADRLALAVTTFGVGYLPLAPGTWGSAVGVAIYLLIERADAVLAAAIAPKFENVALSTAWIHGLNAVIFVSFCLLGIWAASRSTALLGNSDPSEAVVDEVIGQLVTFCFVPFGLSWKYLLTGFLLFRLFDIWKPYPIDDLQNLPTGLGVCADDFLAGIYAGVCLAIVYAVGLSV